MKLTSEWVTDPDGKYNAVLRQADDDYAIGRISLDERNEIKGQAKEYKSAAIKERVRRRMEAES